MDIRKYLEAYPKKKPYGGYGQIMIQSNVVSGRLWRSKFWKGKGKEGRQEVRDINLCSV